MTFDEAITTDKEIYYRWSAVPALYKTKYILLREWDRKVTPGAEPIAFIWPPRSELFYELFDIRDTLLQ